MGKDAYMRVVFQPAGVQACKVDQLDQGTDRLTSLSGLGTHG